VFPVEAVAPLCRPLGGYRCAQQVPTSLAGGRRPQRPKGVLNLLMGYPRSGSMLWNFAVDMMGLHI
jgi:hypothetical protein